jgi:hypothetical protein
LFYYRTYKQQTMGANFRSELEAADGKPTETELKTSHDMGVNTGTSPLFLSHSKPFPFHHHKKRKNYSIFKLSFSW